MERGLADAEYKGTSDAGSDMSAIDKDDETRDIQAVRLRPLSCL